MKEIPLTQGKVALVDEEDFERVSAYRWWAVVMQGRWYAYTRINSRLTAMHRFIMNATGRQPVDHQNHNGLDNRRDNLRPCTQSLNGANRLPDRGRRYKGITWEPDKRRWRAQIRTGGKTRRLGRYRTPEEAARAYDREALKLWGDFAYLNFPPEKDPLN